MKHASSAAFHLPQWPARRAWPAPGTTAGLQAAAAARAATVPFGTGPYRGGPSLAGGAGETPVHEAHVGLEPAALSGARGLHRAGRRGVLRPGTPDRRAVRSA